MDILAHFTYTPSLQPFLLAEVETVARLLSVTLTHQPQEWESSSNSATDGKPHTAADDCASSFAVYRFQSLEDVHRVAERCVLVKSWYHLLASGTSVTLVAQQLTRLTGTASETGPSVDGSSALVRRDDPAAPIDSNHAAHLWQRLRGPSVTFRYQVESFGRRLTEGEKRCIIDAFADVGHEGKVAMKEPDTTFIVFCQYPMPSSSGAGGSAGDKTEHETIDANNGVVKVFHCVLAVKGCRVDLLDRYSLKKRPYIGTTSMPPELTFLMSNFAHVTSGQFVFDPFAGTGSILLSAAHHGAVVLGSDMDGRVLKSGSGKVSEQMRQQQQIAFESIRAYWRSKDQQFTTTTTSVVGGGGGSKKAASVPWTTSAKEIASELRLTQEDMDNPSMLTNFRVYRLGSTPERVRMNFSRWDITFAELASPARSMPSLANEGMFDAILCDPPYGVREQKRRIRVDEATKTSGPQCAPANKISGSSHCDEYDISDMAVDLVMFAARALVVGGRLTYWHPTTYRYTSAELPSHPCMVLEYDIGQAVTLKMTRRLVTMVKRCSIADETERRGGVEISRAECCPTRSTDDIRALMDTVVLPDNAAYQHYREKVAKKRDAVMQWHSEELGTRGAGEAGSTAVVSGSVTGQRSPRTSNDAPRNPAEERFIRPGMTRAQKQAIQVQNRKRNLEERERKHLESQVAQSRGHAADNGEQQP